MNINRVTLQHIKEFIMLIFLFFLFILSMYNLQTRLIREAVWVLVQAMLTLNDWKKNGTAIIITIENTNNQ